MIRDYSSLRRTATALCLVAVCMNSRQGHPLCTALSFGMNRYSRLRLPLARTARARRRQLSSSWQRTFDATSLRTHVDSDAPLSPPRVGSLSLSATTLTASASLSSESSTDNHSLFDDNTWTVYEESIRDIMQRDRVINSIKKKYRVDPEQAVQVQDYLLSNTAWMELPPSASSSLLSSSDTFRSDRKEHQQRFMNATGFSPAQYDYAMRCLTYTGDKCAKGKSSAPVLVAWHKMQESGMVPRENCVSAYMYVLGLSEDDRDTCLEVATFHDLLYAPNEKTITLRIKSYITRGDAVGAEGILDSLPDKGKSAEWKRLRTFLPILSHYCSVGDPSSVLRLFRQMRVSEGVFLDADTYALAIGSLARQGCFRLDAAPIDGATEYGFSDAFGPKLFNELASELADDLLELSESAAKTIFNSFRTGFADTDALGDQSEVQDIPACADFDGRLLLGQVQVNDTTAVCPESGARLRLFTLNERQRKHVHNTLLEMAAAQHEEYGEKLNARSKSNRPLEPRDGDYALQELSKFSEWLINRDGEPFTAFVDGPNVAYFGHGAVHYSQVQLAVDQLERMGERPLVIMPQKYVAPNFWLASTGYMQVLSEGELEIMNRLLATDKMYIVPSGCLDDYYWMLASVANQTDSKLRVSTDDAQGRFPGLRPLLISNDMMRDHRLELLEPRLFRRWKNCHVVNYDIKAYTKSEWEQRRVDFAPADFFSREIQGNKVADASDCMAWHFPVIEWAEPDRLCICISQ